MGTTAEKLQKLRESKQAIKAALESKGKTPGENLSGYANLTAELVAVEGVDGKTITGTIPSKTAETIIPTTEDQTIAAGQYLAGAQTIKGDVNLRPENIRKGVTIMGVEGTMKASVFDYLVTTEEGKFYTKSEPIPKGAKVELDIVEEFQILTYDDIRPSDDSGNCVSDVYEYKMYQLDQNRFIVITDGQIVGNYSSRPYYSYAAIFTIDDNGGTTRSNWVVFNRLAGLNSGQYHNAPLAARAYGDYIVVGAQEYNGYGNYNMPKMHIFTFENGLLSLVKTIDISPIPSIDKRVLEMVMYDDQTILWYYRSSNYYPMLCSFSIDFDEFTLKNFKSIACTQMMVGAIRNDGSTDKILKVSGGYSFFAYYYIAGYGDQYLVNFFVSDDFSKSVVTPFKDFKSRHGVVQDGNRVALVYQNGDAPTKIDHFLWEITASGITQLKAGDLLTIPYKITGLISYIYGFTCISISYSDSEGRSDTYKISIDGDTVKLYPYSKGTLYYNYSIPSIVNGNWYIYDKKSQTYNGEVDIRISKIGYVKRASNAERSLGIATSNITPNTPGDVSITKPYLDQEE